MKIPKEIPSSVKTVSRRKYFTGKKKLKHLNEWEDFDINENKSLNKLKALIGKPEGESLTEEDADNIGHEIDGLPGNRRNEYMNIVDELPEGEFADLKKKIISVVSKPNVLHRHK